MPKVAKELTVKEVQAFIKTKLKNGEVKEKRAGGVSGLVLRVRGGLNGANSVSWLLIYDRGKGVLLGSYPDLSLSEARDKARFIKQQYKEGEDPKQIIKPVNKKPVETYTFGELIYEWTNWKVETKGWTSDGAAKREFNRFKKNFCFVWNTDITEVTTKDIFKCLSPIWRDKTETSNRLLDFGYQFFIWVKEYKGLRTDNPVDKEVLKLWLPPESARKAPENHPYISPERIPSLIKAIWEFQSEQAFRLIASILTCLRSSNARGIEWDDIHDYSNNGVTFPIIEFDAEKMKVRKNGQHKVPLAPEVLKIYEIAQLSFSSSRLVFPSPKNMSVPISDTCVRDVIKDSHAKERALGREGWLDPHLNRIAVPHGICRGSFQTWAIQHDYPDRIIELVIAHVVAKYNGAYDRDESMVKKYELMKHWAAYCCSSIEDEIDSTLERLRNQ